MEKKQSTANPCPSPPSPPGQKCLNVNLLVSLTIENIAHSTSVILLKRCKVAEVKDAEGIVFVAKQSGQEG